MSFFPGGRYPGAGLHESGRELSEIRWCQNDMNKILENKPRHFFREKMLKTIFFGRKLLFRKKGIQKKVGKLISKNVSKLNLKKNILFWISLLAVFLQRS